MFDTVVPGVLARPAQGPSHATLRRFLARAIGAVSTGLSAHQAIHALSRLDERALADIGIHPGELEAAVREGRRHGPMRLSRGAPVDHVALPGAVTKWR